MESKDVLQILFGGIAGAAATNYFAGRRAEREYRLKKLEELLLLSNQHDMAFLGSYEEIIAIESGKKRNPITKPYGIFVLK